MKMLSSKSLLLTTAVVGGLLIATPRETKKELSNHCDNLKELNDKGINISPYFGNYGKAQVAIDSVHTTDFCKSRNVTPKNYEDAKFKEDSIRARDYGIEPYKRTDDELTKLDTKSEITKKMFDELTNELTNEPTIHELTPQMLEVIKERQKLSEQILELISQNKD